MVLLTKLLNFSLVAISQISDELFIFVTRSLESCLDNLELTSRFKQGICRALQLLTTSLKLKPELGLEVLLDTHPEDIRVDGQHHLLGESIKLTLLSLDNLRHLVESLFELVFEGAASGHFIN